MKSFFGFAFFLFMIGCKRPDIERALRSVQSHDYYVESYDRVPPHDVVMSSLIPSMTTKHFQYDSVYVTCLPFRSETEPVYSVKEPNLILYHFFSIKKNINNHTSVIYDPQGDEIQKYMGQIY